MTQAVSEPLVFARLDQHLAKAALGLSDFRAGYDIVRTLNAAFDLFALQQTIVGCEHESHAIGMQAFDRLICSSSIPTLGTLRPVLPSPIILPI